jgi:hypothetical protein
LKLLSGLDAVVEAAEPMSNGWICIETNSAALTAEVVVSRKSASGGSLVLVTLPGDGATARLWLTKESAAAAWVWSEYGGMSCVNLSDPKAFCAPSVLPGLIEQHPNTREMVWLQLPEAKVWLLRPFAAADLLCTLSGIVFANVKSMFLMYQMIGVLDDGGSRCSVFDLGSGSLLRSFAVVAGGLSIARVVVWAPFVLLWSRSSGLSSLQAEAVSQVQALLPPARGAKMSQV